MATKKTKSTKSIKSAPVLRDAETYKNSAGVKLPNADLIIEAEQSGTVTSCRDAVTGTEYVGGGGGSGAGAFIVNITAPGDEDATIDKSYAEILSAYQAGSLVVARVVDDLVNSAPYSVLLNFEEDNFVSTFVTFNLEDEGEGALIPVPIYKEIRVFLFEGQTSVQVSAFG